jgi:hypothetical protein
MVLALDNDDGALHAFQSIAEAAAHCKGVDVDDGFWRFFAEDGSPLEARWEGPAARGDDSVSRYTLQRAMSGLWLQERLAQVVTVSGCGLTSIAELVETLKINRGKRVERDSTRR